MTQFHLISAAFLYKLFMSCKMGDIKNKIFSTCCVAKDKTRIISSHIWMLSFDTLGLKFIFSHICFLCNAWKPLKISVMPIYQNNHKYQTFWIVSNIYYSQNVNTYLIYNLLSKNFTFHYATNDITKLVLY